MARRKAWATKLFQTLPHPVAGGPSPAPLKCIAIAGNRPPWVKIPIKINPKTLDTNIVGEAQTGTWNAAPAALVNAHAAERSSHEYASPPMSQQVALPPARKIIARVPVGLKRPKTATIPATTSGGQKIAGGEARGRSLAYPGSSRNGETCVLLWKQNGVIEF